MKVNQMTFNQRMAVLEMTLRTLFPKMSEQWIDEVLDAVYWARDEYEKPKVPDIHMRIEEW